jgi:hypothetical protein
MRQLRQQHSGRMWDWLLMGGCMLQHCRGSDGFFFSLPSCLKHLCKQFSRIRGMADSMPCVVRIAMPACGRCGGAFSMAREPNLQALATASPPRGRAPVRLPLQH